MRPLIRTAAIVASAALVAFRCSEPPRPATVQTATVERRDLRRAVTVRGRFTPKRYVEIRAPAGSVVKDVLAAVGDRVEEGQPLLKIASPAIAADPSAALPLLERETSSARQSLEAADLALEAQQRALERDATALEAARRTFERLERLYNEGLLARLEFEQEREKVAGLVRGIELRKREFEQMRQERSAIADRLAAAQRRERVIHEAREQAEDSPRLRTLNAPEAGYVAMIADRGAETVEEAVASLALAEGLTLRIEADGPIDADSIAQVETPDEELSGRTGGPDGREIELEALPARLFDGAVAVTIEAAERHQALTIPQQALRESRWVFVVREGTLLRRPVEAGVAVNGAVEIKSGLEAGESVVLSPGPDLHDGDPVVVQNGRD